MLVTVNVAAPTQYQQDMAMRWFQQMSGGVMEFHKMGEEPFFIFQWRNSHPLLDETLVALRRLCDTTRQDCVAVMFDHKGFLIGPEPEGYGEFDLDKFTFPRYTA